MESRRGRASEGKCVSVNLKLIHKRNYGRDLYFPLCQISATILKMMDRMTFTAKDMLMMKEANWKIEIVPWTKDLE